MGVTPTADMHWSAPITLRDTRLRIGLLLLALLVYGCFSDPTPDDPGMAEMLIGALLVALALRDTLRLLGGELLFRHPAIPSYVLLSIAYLIIVVSIVGLLVRGNAFSDFVRDFIPLLFMFFPLFIWRDIREHPEIWSAALLWGIVLSGILLGARFLEEGTQTSTEYYLILSEHYLNQDPSVLFAATFLILASFVAASLHRYYYAAAALLAGSIAYSSVIFGVMRLQIIMVAGSVAILAGIGFLRGKRWLGVSILTMVSAMLVVDGMGDSPGLMESVLFAIQSKSDLAGLVNQRDIEMSEVLNQVFSTPDYLLAGAGWGAKIFTSSMGGEVRFLHNLAPYILWKGGLLGLVALIAYFLWIYQRSSGYILAALCGRLSFLDLAIVLGILNSLLVYTFVEPGYKMLTYGGVLALLLARSSLYNIKNNV